MNLKKHFRSLWLKVAPELNSRQLESWVRVPQPRSPRARIVLTALTKAGASAYGKVSAREFLPDFCGTLRGTDSPRHGFQARESSPGRFRAENLSS